MEFADACYVCGLGEMEEGDSDQMLVCDSCNYRICHLKCCKLEIVPEGDWFCIDCIENQPLRSNLGRRRRRRRFRRRRQPGEPKKKRRRRKKRKGQQLLANRRSRRNGSNSEDSDDINIEDDEYAPSLGADSESGNSQVASEQSGEEEKKVK